MRKFISLALLFFSFSPLYAENPSKIETLRQNDFSIQKELSEIKVPEIPSPKKTESIYSEYDYSQLPTHIFTEETKFTPILLNAIKNVNYTLDVALYNINIQDLSQALVDAAGRGVKVRLIFDLGHAKPDWHGQIKFLKESGMDIKVMNGRGGSGSMHNKYAIFDSAILQTGSANWTSHAQDLNYENMMFISDRHIIRGYQDNFEWMWAQARAPNNINATGPPPGPLPQDPAPSINFNEVIFPKYVFSPRGETEKLIIKAIDAAQKEIDLTMFTFTSKPIMEALLKAANNGITVNLLLSSGQNFPHFDAVIRLPNMTLRFSDGRALGGFMHNKYAVIDDALLINGAFNWSFSAQDKNAENTLFLTNPVYVTPFKNEFVKLYNNSSEAK